MLDSSCPLSLTRRWLEGYAEYIFHTIALRDLVRCGASRTAIQPLMTTRLSNLMVMADQLYSFGIRPSLQLAGAEGKLWKAASHYIGVIESTTPLDTSSDEALDADLKKRKFAWKELELLVGELPGDFYQNSPLLAACTSRNDRIAQVFGLRISPSTKNAVTESPDQMVSPLIV